MKKSILCFSLLLSHLSTLGAIGYYDCGLYGSVQAGWARICTPTCNDLGCDSYYYDENVRFQKIEGQRGSAAWGANIGYHYPYCANLLASFEAGYHDNGSSFIKFKNCNEYRIKSTDVELLGAVTYVWRQGVWFTLKGGAAKVRQTYGISHIVQNFDIDIEKIVKAWVPTTSFAAGVSFCGLEFFAMYRYVFANDLTNVSDTFEIQKDLYCFPGTLVMKPKIAKLHSIYAGIQASLY